MLLDPDEPLRPDRSAQLERAFMLEYLAQHGYTLADLHDLSTDEADVLLRAASIYASARLTEVESRARYVHDLHGH